MRKKIHIFFTCIFAFIIFANNVLAQQSEGGTPPSFLYKSATTFDQRKITPIDVAQAQAEDANRPGPLWAGRSISVGLNMNNAGTWTVLPDGTKIWRLKLLSAGAKAIAVCYDDFFIPEGGKLFLYNETQNQVIGAFTSRNNPTAKLFSTELIQGETVTLEYVAPTNIPKKTPLNEINGYMNGNKIINSSKSIPSLISPSISISEIAYVYNDLPLLSKYLPSKATGWKASGSCEVNVNCSEGTNWQKQKRGVAEIFLKNGTSWGFCSGDLINTTNNSGIPYFLTADHCHSEGTSTASASDMLQWQFYFNYEASTCTTPSSEPTYNSLTGCVLKASSPINGGSDFCLVLLNSTPPQSYKPYYNGWDRTNTATSSGVGIHHPAGDIKKISTFTTTPTSASWNDGTNVGTTNAHWNFVYAATTNGHGVVEGGSSGSPLFNSNGVQFGTLTGGSSSCTVLAGANYYGKFYYHWNLDGSSSAQKLQPWLDPLGTNPSTISGFDPYNGFPDFYGTPTAINEGQSVNYTDLTVGATAWTWAFDGGTPSTSNIQNPTSIYYYQQGTYAVSLTTLTSGAGNQTQTKTAYITVSPGPATTQIYCDDFSSASNWTLTTSSGTTAPWIITTAAPAGSYSSPMGRLNSTSGGNYGLFDSDKNGAAGANQCGYMTMVNGQNCSNYEKVYLKFLENYVKFYDSTLVLVSSDNFTTSTKYVVNSTYLNNQASANPETEYIDISTAAAGKTNVKVRFTFRSTQNMSSGAGWGYAWEIDDVCLYGVLPGNSLPNPNFIATSNTKISQGQSVSFADQSQYATSWSWSFPGGIPSSSTSQNPSNIVYNTQGYYPVTLTAINKNGYIASTKTNYIHVFYDCDYDSNIQSDDAMSLYLAGSGKWGYTPGHNNTGITAYADKYTIGNLTGQVKSLAIAVGIAQVVGNATSVTFTIWDNNAGVPGTILGTRVIPVSQLTAATTNYVNFAPVTVGSTFFAGFQLNFPAKLDTFACYVRQGGANRVNTAYCYNGNTWTTFQATFGVNASLYIMPEFCFSKPSSSLPDVDFFADQTEILPGTAINYTDQTTGVSAPTAWSWALPGGTPTTSAIKNPSSVSYTVSGFYDASLTATNINGSSSGKKVAYIHVAPTTNIVYWTFPSTGADAIADGGISANSAMVITADNSGGTAAITYTTSGATTKCAATTKFTDDISTYNDYWQVAFSTVGYTNIKLSSKQSGAATTAPRNFEIYYSIDGGTTINKVCDVPPMTTANNWTQGVVGNYQLPSDCDNQSSVMIMWLKSSNTSMAGGTISSAGASLIDDIYVSGQACSNLPAAAGTISGMSTICQGQSGVVYSVPAITGATAYSWSVPTGAVITSGQYTNTITVSYSLSQAAGNINVYGVNLCGNGTISSNFPIAVNPVPVSPGIVSGMQSITGGQTGVVYSVSSVSGATNYSWTIPSFATITSGATTNSVTLSFACPGDVGNISVHANNGCGVGNESFSKTLTISCPPVADFYASSTQACSGSSVTYTDFSTNTPTSWSWSFQGGNPTTSIISRPIVTYTTPGTYTVSLKASNASGSSTTTKTGYIIINGTSGGVSILASSNTICAGTNVVFTASPLNGGLSPVYQWKLNGANVGTGGTIYSNSNLTNGNSITCVMTSNSACVTGSPFTSNAISMTVNSLVTAGINISTLTNTVCSGSSVTFNATGTNGGSNPIYQWTLNGSNVGANSSNYSNSGLINNDKIACVLTSNASCVSGSPATSSNVSMVVNPNPSITVNNPAICIGNSGTLIASGGSSYAWSNALGTGNSKVVNPGSVTNYFVTGTDNNGCVGTAQATVNVNMLPTVSANGGTTCSGSNISISANGANNYAWSNGLGTSNPVNANPTSTTIYSVSGTDNNGCVGTAQALVYVNVLPSTPTISMSNDTLYSSSLTGNQWYQSPSTLINGETNNYYYPGTSGSYYVVVTDNNLCVSNPSSNYNFTYTNVIEKNTEILAQLFPNPNNGKFYLKVNNASINNNLQLKIVNLIGVVIIQKNINDEKTLIDISQYADGIYFAELNSNNGNLMFKVSLKK